MSYKLTVNIDSLSFPEFGNPSYPKKYEDSKGLLPKETKNKIKDQYDSYYKNAYKTLGDPDIMSLRNSGNPTSISKDSFNLELDYEEGTPKTYTFLGMKIDDTYEAVIPLNEGYVKIAPMFDEQVLLSFEKSSRTDPTVRDYANDIIRRSSQNLAKVVSTAMKTGALYDLYKSADRSGTFQLDVLETKNASIVNLDPLVKLVKSEVLQVTGASNGGTPLKFKSILLNIVERNKLKDRESRMVDSGKEIENIDDTVSAYILCKLFTYWSNVLEKYTMYNSLLSELDLWSSLCKAGIGDRAFNDRMKSCITLTDKDTGELSLGKIISFAGVARDDGISDANTYKKSIRNQLSSMSDLLSGFSSWEVLSLQDLMLGNIDYESFGNPFDLSAEELQAISSYDSLKYIDEDAKTCMESYNMNDPEDRSLFIRSAIKSYDRNFRAFKSVNDYDVAQAFSDMVEKGVTFGDRIVSKDSVVEPDMTQYEVTSTSGAIDRNEIKKSLIKVGKLLHRSLDDIDKLFLANTSATTSSQNP